MKKLYIFGLILLVVISHAATISAGDALKRYPEVKSGIIKYEISGMNQGTEVLYFDDWGSREAKYTNTTMSMMGMTQKTNSATIITDSGKWIYNYDLDTRTGTRMKNPMFEDIKGKSEKELTQMGDDMMKAMGGVKTGTEKIAGKKCDIWELKSANSKTCIWKGITLKTESGMGMMKMTIIATEVKEGVSIPKDKLKIPADVKFKAVGFGGAGPR